MELVLKPTNVCNFKCSFCSSSRLSRKEINLNLIEDFIKKHSVDEVIVNGGDPLMMPPSFYYKLYELLLKYNPKSRISFTTNLWDWYENPDKWNNCFRDCNIGICTSFQYGGGRLKGDGSVFSEEDFLKIFNKFEDTFNEKLTYISVLTNENEKFAFKNVELAQSLDTKCKLNGAVMSGRQGYLYNREKLFRIYLELFLRKLDRFESNCINIRNYFLGKNTICPIPESCLTSIACMSPEGRISNCPSLNDDGIDDGSKFKFFKPECLACEFFKICCGCHKMVHDLRTENNQLLDCTSFKELLKQLRRICLEC